MSSNVAYITRSAVCLPNAPVENDEVEAVLGQVGTNPSRARRIVQRSNGIKRRYYVIDPQTGAPRYTNASLTAAAIKALIGEGLALDDIACLVCGTSSPDQMLPNHAVMVHGELGGPLCEVVATSGICVSGTTALKYGWLSVVAGNSRNAVVTGSEVASIALHARNYTGDRETDAEKLDLNPELSFGQDFLRWMLSDGAGALLLEAQPRCGLNLRIDWIDVFSCAHELPACMYTGAEKQPDGSLRSWMLYSPHEREAMSLFTLRQDVKLLNEEIADHMIRPLQIVRERRSLAADQIDWFLPHMSSEYFRPAVVDGLARAGVPIPESRWFTNLAEVGNAGSASIYIMLDELLRSGKLRDGQRLLGFVPESGRFSSAFIHMTVVSHA